MRKNKMMRIASILLVVTLLSTCVISGTFAKYVTKAEGEDQARVAKWGVIVSVNGGAFSDKYLATDAKYKAADGKYSVESSVEAEAVVAPGTSPDDIETADGAAFGKLTASVMGTPEVAARYALTLSNVSDVVLPAGTYTDYTELVATKDDNGIWSSAYSKEFTLDKAYAPIKWDLNISKNGGEPISLAAKLIEKLPEDKLEKAKKYGLSEDGCSIYDACVIMSKVMTKQEYIDAVGEVLGQIVSGGRNFQLTAENGDVTLSYDFDPNKEMNFTFELTWKWAFENGEEIKDEDGNGTGIYEFDAADTFLGNWAAVKMGQTIEGFQEPDAPASIVLGATLTASATQID